MQMSAALAFKFGVMASVWLMMILYRRMHPNVVLGVGFGGAFLLAQLSIAVAFHSALSAVQMCGVGVMAAGIAALALGGERGQSAA